MVGGSAKKGGNLKQGTLFSFFSKKPVPSSTTAASTSSAPPTGSSSSSSSVAGATKRNPASISPPSTEKSGKSTSSAPSSAATNNSTNNTLWKQVKVGDEISVYWPDDDQYYDAVVERQKSGSDSNFYIRYDDGEQEWVDLSTETFQILDTGKPKKKRRKIHSDSEDDDGDDGEAEFEDGDEEEDEELYEDDIDDEEEEDDDQWMVSDNEDEKPKAKKNKSKKLKKLKVTPHQPSTNSGVVAKKSSTSSVASTPISGTYNTPLKQFANSAVAPANSGTVNSAAAAAAATTTGTPFRVPSSANKATTPASAASKMSTLTSSLYNKQGDKVPMFIKEDKNGKKVVNVKGSHVHNHLKFLQNPRDSQGRTRDDPNYDPRTLKVDYRELEKHEGGKKLTEAKRQWWELKSQYFDTVLLFKVGKFYELFHMDADVGVEVLGFKYMKGHEAHAGSPEAAYARITDLLVRAGYKVASVEQTETPEKLKMRKQLSKGKGKAPQVVNREVCSIQTLGTRTFCYMDLEKDLTSEGESGIGPLLSIREIIFDDDSSAHDMSQEKQDEYVRPVCEYGVTIVDAIHGTVTIGQFADDVLRSRMNTLLTSFAPSEIILQGGEQGASPELQSLIKFYRSNARTPTTIDTIMETESFPKSTALDPQHRHKLQRRTTTIHPWDVKETLDELHRRGYYPKASRQQEENQSVSRWPKVLKAAVEGNAELALSSFGAALFYLQRNLIDSELLSFGVVKAYIPPVSATATREDTAPIRQVMTEQIREEAGIEDASGDSASQTPVDFDAMDVDLSAENQITNMALDGTTLYNLEILTNSVDHKAHGSLWSKINYTKTPHGARLLRAWLLRPLFRKVEIDRRADAVEELVSGAGAVALSEAQKVLSKIGDLDRLLNRVHSMSGNHVPEEQEGEGYHPNQRAVLYETATYTKRKVGDFSKLLNGLRKACEIPELFADIDLESGLLRNIVKYKKDGGCFPEMAEQLDFFFDVFDCEKAAKGMYEPSRGVDQLFDDACDTIERIKAELEDYKHEMCNNLTPRHIAKSQWNFVNLKVDSKDKYLIELPASVEVPDDFIVKGKRLANSVILVCMFVQEYFSDLLTNVCTCIPLFLSNPLLQRKWAEAS
jgi:DNA mismatch repair protein MSH6